ncbi:hypothetical protein TraAM80_00068 [Trypanosoma rangeli]|uniref:Uncharacterized protein n=1 Tax=Trypanosoma rangeli TaxID=5698 RepID=A0A3R7NWI3_TRYRA|nr:uncharacterized protein TraAM80_00068 [Trypanosoma rangeli]RNF12910.1 hypothetical protein TraAM80_00068 [Trypanosoma rangeli]|eukprot:RNF12910.1 hypothetical protein TraAM80_00068 [Trypanosoma rangeli]
MDDSRRKRELGKERGRDKLLMVPPLFAINVCIVSPSFDAAAIPLSWSLCPSEGHAGMRWEKERSYRLVGLEERVLHRGYGYPHCTVAQLSIRPSDLDALRSVVREIWVTMKESMERLDATLKLAALENGPVFATTADGTEVRLPSIKIVCSETLLALHENIVRAIRPFHVPPTTLEVGKAAFHPSFPTDNAVTVEWLKKYLSEHSLEAYNPHVTLGASTVKSLASSSFFKPTAVPWRNCRLVVSRMGNYCSCFEVYD